MLRTFNFSNKANTRHLHSYRCRYGTLVTIILLLLFRDAACQENVRIVTRFVAATDSLDINKVLFSFEDSTRTTWSRTPGQRQGLAIYSMSKEQKKLLHLMLSQVLTTAGYNKITHILFNEDLSVPVDPLTGPNKYWLGIYGKPSAVFKWGWKLEGHHLSLNFTFRGNTLISTTPFGLGSYPAVVESDSVREGFRNLSNEIDLGLYLVNSLSPDQLKKCVIGNESLQEVMLGAQSVIVSAQPIGIRYSELYAHQQAAFADLLQEYFGNTHLRVQPEFDNIKFAWWGPTNNSGKYSYRIHSKDVLIEFEDIGNHIHCVIRDPGNDFGKK